MCRNAILVASLWLIGAYGTRADEREELFEAQIRPVLVGTCFRCHGAQKAGGGFRVDSREALLKGGDSGAAVVPGKPDESLLLRAVQRQDDVAAMPPEKDKALRADQVAAFVTWIRDGAVWPPQTARFEVAKHWAFEPIREAAPPAVLDKSWVKTSVDAFIRAKQEAAGVGPAAPADRLALIRRATFDLTGLPPTPEAVAEFEKDDSPRAFATVVDRLLESSAYGERWGRHWLDVVRFADTAGETADYPVPVAWRYRNYVIAAFNADKPYDEFLREQIAGDILARQGSRERYAERATATGYLAISRRFGFDSENYHHLTIQDTIDVLGQSVLGLSLGCVRCHDHKFDPISMRDYYALYGIFDSSRYAFPGSEQKQRVRAMLPLEPPLESQPKWREFDARVSARIRQLEQQKQPVPTVILRSLDDFDGDFELQAPAAGGSNGVLVPPWTYEGKVAVTNAAQSPFKNLYARGKVGAHVPAGVGEYRISQAIYPRRSRDNSRVLHVNLDFRVAAPAPEAKGAHRVWLGTRTVAATDSTTAAARLAFVESPAVELLISAEAVVLRAGDASRHFVELKPNEWHNLQLTLDLHSRTFSGNVASADGSQAFSGQPFSPAWSGSLDFLCLEGRGSADGMPPSIEWDNFGLQETPLAIASIAPPALTPTGTESEAAALNEQLAALTGIDGDLERQVAGAPPAHPWHPGPNSVVKLSPTSQSPYRNIYPAGVLGLHLPNRGEYDGFGQTLVHVKPDKDGRLFVGFDFRCGNQEAGGHGAWRYYLGHGPGGSAAVELFFNGGEFFRRSAAAREPVCKLKLEEWYQVRLTLDLKARVYTGVLASRAGQSEFSGELATGWDGTIDYTFIDSYGHLGGVRPALDADNFVMRDTPLPPLDAPSVTEQAGEPESRQAKIGQIRQRLAALQAETDKARQELNTLLADGPDAMTYGVVEGTPHDARMQLRGEPDRPGAEVPRGFLKMLGGETLSPTATGSGRLELAHWLTRPDNPLTARVMVNRLWQYHFGRGLVRTPNDFGVRGLPPTHPELLDHLAAEFMRRGWSIKAMHRLLMLSSTYQQSSLSHSAPSAVVPDVDPATFYAAFTRRRLSAEEIRDSILAVSGELDTTPGREHPFPSSISWGYSQHGPFSAVYDHNKRSVYLMTQRLKRHPFLALFDGADPNATTAERLGTTVPTQALFFLNDPFVHDKAERWAARLCADRPDEGQTLERAFRQALGRAPSEVERVEATRFLAEYRQELAAAGVADAETRALAAYLRTLFGSNEFLHVD